MVQLEIRCLGPFQAMLDQDVAVTFPSAKVRALLVFLAMEAETPHRREALAALLWPDYPERQARQNLSQTLYALRQAIGPPLAEDLIAATRQTIRMVRDERCQVDAATLTALYQACQRHSHSALEGCPSCERRLIEVIDLYHGPFMEGLALSDSEPFDAWMMQQRAYCQRLYVDALHSMTALALARGEHDSGLEYAQRCLTENPLDEQAHRHAMALFAASGQRTAALTHYRQCCKTLRQELDVDPEPETVDLFHHIRDGEAGPPLSRRQTTTHFPVPLVPTVGRDAELAHLRERLSDPTCRLLTVLGPGGTGKTHLALEAAEAARAAAQHFEHGIFFVPLSATKSTTRIIPAITASLDLTLYRGRGNLGPKEQLLAYLRSKQLLLILDGCEHLLDSARWNIATWVKEMLTAAPNIKILATSRTRLNLPGEQVFLLEGLSQEAASELFVAAAGRVRPGYVMSQAEAPSIAAICQRVEGMPLGLLLAASWMGILSPDQIAAELEQDAGHGIAFLSTDWHGLSERERSMQATLDRSWVLLSKREQRILAGLAVFSRGFTASAAEAITGAHLRDLARLADRSLIMRQEAGRYDLHDLLRAYASLRLAESADGGEMIRNRHAAYYANTLTEWEEDIRHGREEQAISQMEVEWENIRDAWFWAVKQGRWDWIERSTMTISRFAVHTDRQAVTAPLWAAAAQRLGQAVADTPTHAASGKVLGLLGRITATRAFLSTTESQETKIAALRSSLTLLEKAAQTGEDVRFYQSCTLCQLAECLPLGQDEEAIQYCAAAVELDRALGDKVELSTALCVGGSRLIDAKRFDKARRWLEESLALRRQFGCTTWLMECYEMLGWLASYEQHHDEAAHWEEKAMETMRDITNEVHLQRAKFGLSRTLFKQGRFQKARTLMQQHVAFLEERGLTQALADNLIHLGLDEYFGGLYEAAQANLEKALALFQEVGDDFGAHCCYFQLGWLALGTEDVAEAERWLARCVREPQDVAYLISLLGAAVATLAGRWGEAQHYLGQVLRYRFGAEALPLVALYCAARGDVERAVELYALARTNPWVVKSQWHQDVFGKRIAAAAEASLSPAAIAAAEERGRARDWQATMDELADSFPA